MSQLSKGVRSRLEKSKSVLRNRKRQIHIDLAQYPKLWEEVVAACGEMRCSRQALVTAILEEYFGTQEES